MARAKAGAADAALQNNTPLQLQLQLQLQAAQTGTTAMAVAMAVAMVVLKLSVLVCHLETVAYVPLLAGDARLDEQAREKTQTKK